MPIYAKQTNTWYQGNAASKLIYAKQGGTWYAASFVYAKSGGIWRSTGYVGKPNAPSGLGVTSAADNFGQVSLGYAGPSTGAAVDYYITRMYNSSDALLATVDSRNAPNSPGYSLFNVSQDTAYRFRVFAVNSAGESPASNIVQYAIGHPQQTRQDPVYGWGATYDWGGDTADWTTEAAGHNHAYATDWAIDPSGCFTTTWLSVTRASASKAEAVRIYPLPGRPADSRLVTVRMWLTWGRRLFVGLYNIAGGFWYGGTNYLINSSLWYDTAANNTFGHDYCHASAVGVPSNTEYDYYPAAEGIDIRAGNMILDVAVDQLDFTGGGYRGGLVEVILQFQDWVVVSYTTVVTVAQQNNYTW